MRYYTASGEPPGQWAGKGAAALGLSGEVDAKVMDRLYMEHVGPDGELLTRPRGKARRMTTRRRRRSGRRTRSRRRPRWPRRWRRRGPARGSSVPYYDLTVSAAKSISVLHASLKIAAQEAYKRGDLVTAGKLNAEADGIEADLEAAARFAARARRSRGLLHPDRAPLGHDGGVAGRGRADRGDVHPPHQPGRGPAAARAHRDREPGAAGRRRRTRSSGGWTPGPCITSGCRSRRRWTGRWRPG